MGPQRLTCISYNPRGHRLLLTRRGLHVCWRQCVRGLQAASQVACVQESDGGSQGGCANLHIYSAPFILHPGPCIP